MDPVSHPTSATPADEIAQKGDKQLEDSVDQQDDTDAAVAASVTADTDK